MQQALALTRHLVGVVIMLVTIAGCVSTKHSDFVRSEKALRVDEPIYNIKAVRLSDGTVRLSFIGTPTLRTTGRYVKYVEAALGGSEDSMNDNVMFNTTTAGAPGVNETVHLVGTASWDTRDAINSKSCWADVSVVTPAEHLIFRVHLEYEASEPMLLEPFTEAVNDTTIELGAIARRVFVPPGEYLPSSETFRIIVTDASGYVVYRSDYERNFLSIVTTVQPTQPNQMQRYVVPWSGRNLQGQRIGNGKYSVEMVIPAFPKPYRATTTMEWPPK